MKKERVCILETDVDDVAGEILGALIDDLTERGALNVSVFPCTTKKSRPGYLIRVLCKEKQSVKLIRFIVQETGSLGVRVLKCERFILPRRIKTITIPVFGKSRKVKIKTWQFPDGRANTKPEFADIQKIARETGHSLKTTRQEIMKNII